MEIPTWAHYFLDVGMAAAAAVGPHLNLGLAVPSRTYAAALAACGIVITRAALLVEQLSPAKHFELICNLPGGTPVSLLIGDKIKKGVFDGCTDHHGLKCARIMVEQKSSGGGAHFIWESDAFRVKVLHSESINLPKKQMGRLAAPIAEFARNILGVRQAYAFAGRPRLECLIIGRVNDLRQEIIEPGFATSSDCAVYHEGRLQDILQVHRFLNGGESYRSNVCHANEKSTAFANDGAPPPFVIFDGASGFIRWRDHLRNSNWIVILDKTDARFREAAEILNQAYLRRIDDNGLANLPSPPAGVEVMSFYERRC